MAYKWKTYLKALLWTGLPFGIAMGAWHVFEGGNIERALVQGVTAGLVFGVLLSALLGALQWMTAGASNGAVQHQAMFRTSSSREEVFGACKRALRGIERSTVKQHDLAAGLLRATTGITWKTFGDEIVFHLEPATNGELQLTVTSRPLLRTTLFDYGKNRQNIQAIAAALCQTGEFSQRSETRVALK